MGNQNATDERISRCIDLHLEIAQLKTEIRSLKDDNNELRKELRAHLARPRSPTASKASKVSAVVVNDFVETLLADPTVNVAFVPDAIERPMQRKMLLTLLNAIAHAVDSTSIQLMGHEITLSMQPAETGERTLTTL